MASCGQAQRNAALYIALSTSMTTLLLQALFEQLDDFIKLALLVQLFLVIRGAPHQRVPFFLSKAAWGLAVKRVLRRADVCFHLFALLGSLHQKRFHDLTVVLWLGCAPAGRVQRRPLAHCV